jgi:uncharacterized membrane protein YcgQ (UPF0703/DUF1980 family)
LGSRPAEKKLRGVKRALCCLFVFLLLAAGCGQSGGNSGERIIEIRENMFIGQISDIYMNLQDYSGKTIKCQGIFGQATDPSSGGPLYSVFRQTPGCCGNDGIAGLEVIWAKEGKYPDKDAWVEAVGVLEVFTLKDGEGLIRYPRLRLTSLNVLPEEGARFVTK